MLGTAGFHGLSMKIPVKPRNEYYKTRRRSKTVILLLATNCKSLPGLLANLRLSCDKGWREGSESKGAFCQAWGLEFHPRDLTHCPLASTDAAWQVACMGTHTNNCFFFFNLKSCHETFAQVSTCINPECKSWHFPYIQGADRKFNLKIISYNSAESNKVSRNKSFEKCAWPFWEEMAKFYWKI